MAASKDTRLGTLAVARGLLSREELLRILTRRAERGAGRRAPAGRRTPVVGEALVTEHYVSMPVLEGLLEEQRYRRGETPLVRRARIIPEPPAAGLRAALAHMRLHGGLELLIGPGRPRALRIADRLVELDEPRLDAAAAESLIGDAYTPEEIAEARRGQAVAKILTPPGNRFRAIVFPTDAGLVMAIRALNLELEAGPDQLPPHVAELARLRRGLVVIAGAGAATRAEVLASLVEIMNRETRRHIIVIERHMTYEHPSRASFVAQREIGCHTESYESALRTSLREDPDVLVVGELYDPEAIATALLAAETGHLVICSLHAPDAAHALRRLIDVHGEGKRSLVRTTLASTLRAVAIIDVVPGRDGERFLVADLVPGTETVARLVREDRLHQLYSVAEAASGIRSRDERIVELYATGRVSRLVALEHLANHTRLDGVPEPPHAAGSEVES